MLTHARTQRQLQLRLDAVCCSSEILPALLLLVSSCADELKLLVAAGAALPAAALAGNLSSH